MNMSPRIPLLCGRRSCLNGQCGSGGFTLLELVLVLFVLGALAAALAPSVRDIVERSRREAEARSLDELANTINASFENTDLTNLNVAALPGTTAGTDSTTVFSASTTALYTTTDNAAWFAKVARLRGLSPRWEPHRARSRHLPLSLSIRWGIRVCFSPGRTKPAASVFCW